MFGWDLAPHMNLSSLASQKFALDQIDLARPAADFRRVTGQSVSKTSTVPMSFCSHYGPDTKELLGSGLSHQDSLSMSRTSIRICSGPVYRRSVPTPAL